MKKIICILFALMLFSTVSFAANENITFDFPADLMSENPDDLPKDVVIENGFHNGIWLGKLSTTCTLGHPITFKFENLSLDNYGAVSFGLMSQYVDEDSTLEIKFIDENGEEHIVSRPLTTTDAEMYVVKMPKEKKIVGFEIFVNSLPDDNSMYDIELEFVKFHKGFSVMLLSTKESLAILGRYKIVPDSPAVIRDGSTLTPARFVAESFGAKVEWIASERKVVITRQEWTKDGERNGETKIELVIDSKTALVNGEEKELAYPACIIDDYTYTPARFVAENLGCTVDWDAQTKTVFIDSGYDSYDVYMDEAK